MVHSFISLNSWKTHFYVINLESITNTQEEDISESDVYTEEQKFKENLEDITSTSQENIGKYKNYFTSKKYDEDEDKDNLAHFNSLNRSNTHNSSMIRRKKSKSKNLPSRVVTLPFHRPKFMDNVQKIPKKVNNSFKSYNKLAKNPN